MTFEVTEEGNSCAGMLAFGSDRGRQQEESPPDQLANGVDGEAEVGADGPGGEELSAPPPLFETPLSVGTTECDVAAAQPIKMTTASFSGLQLRPSLLLPQPVSATFTSSAQNICGLKNLGNTCYANSILQALYSLSRIRRHLYKMEDPEHGGPFHRTLGTLFYEMRRNSRTQGASTKPAKFCQKFRLAKAQFRRNEQQDAQEFLSLLLDLLHDECNSAKKQGEKVEKGDPFLLKQTPSTPSHPSPPDPAPAPPAPSNAEEAWKEQLENVDNSLFSRLLMGQTESCLTCQTCGNSSISWSSFWQLPLAVQKKKAIVAGKEEAKCSLMEQDQQENANLSLADCISEFMETEILSDDCAPLCEKCNRREPASKKLTIVRSPRYLILHLKRFDVNGTKITRHVTISSQLHLAGKKYNLRCCVLHRGGEVHQGHYTTLIAMKEPVPDPVPVLVSAFALSLTPSAKSPSTMWMLADDEVITPRIPEERALSLMKRHAYIAVYEQTVLEGGGMSSINEQDVVAVDNGQQPEEEEVKAEEEEGPANCCENCV